MARLQAAAPTAIRLNRYPEWLAAIATQKIISPPVPLEGGWLGLWGKTFRVQNALSVPVFGIGLMIAAPNLVDGLRDGTSGLIHTKSGRTGVVQAAESTLAATVIGAAAFGGRSEGLRGMVRSYMSGAKWRASWKLAVPNLLLAQFVPLNELGFFDGLDKGDSRTVLESSRDSLGKIGNAIQKAQPAIGALAAVTGAISVVAGLRAHSALPVAVGAAVGAGGLAALGDSVMGAG